MSEFFKFILLHLLITLRVNKCKITNWKEQLKNSGLGEVHYGGEGEGEGVHWTVVRWKDKKKKEKEEEEEDEEEGEEKKKEEEEGEKKRKKEEEEEEEK